MTKAKVFPRLSVGSLLLLMIIFISSDHYFRIWPEVRICFK